MTEVRKRPRMRCLRAKRSDRGRSYPCLGAGVLFLALAWSAPAIAAQDDAEAPAYPFDFFPQDAIRGHLMEGEFKEPCGVFFDRQANEILVADAKNNLIGIFDPEGIPLFAFGGLNLLNDPRSVVTSADGSIFVLDSNREVKAFSYRGEPRPPLRFEYPPRSALEDGVVRVAAFTTDDAGNFYVGGIEPAQVLVYDRELELLHTIRPGAGELSFGIITGLAVSRDGLIAVLDYEKTPIQIFDAEGRFLAGFGRRDSSLGGFSAPIAAAFDDDGFLYVVDMLRHNVKVFTSAGRFMTLFGGWFADSDGRAPGELLYPNGIAISPGHGPVYVAERFGNRVQIFRRVPKNEDPEASPRLRIPAVGDEGK